MDPREVAARLDVLKVHLDAGGLETKGYFDRLVVTNPQNGRTATVNATPYEEHGGDYWFFALMSDPVGIPISHVREATTATALLKGLLADSLVPADISAVLSGKQHAARLVKALAEASQTAATIAAENGRTRSEVIHAALVPQSPEELGRLRMSAVLIAEVATSMLAGQS